MSEDLQALLTFLRDFRVAESLDDRRKNYNSAAKAWPLPEGYAVEPWVGEVFRGEIVRVPGAAPLRAILYLHGGGFCMGSPRSHRHLAARIGAACGSDVYVLDYRLAPEHPFPAAYEDALSAFRQLVAAGGRRVAIVGDSAGGGLSVICATAARDAGLAPPVGVACISPWTDLSLAAALPYSPADPMMRIPENQEYARAYLGGADSQDPRICPLKADLAGLPPVLIQVGSLESLYADAAHLAEALRLSGTRVVLDVEEGAPHVWPWYWPKLGIGRQSVERIGAFLTPLFG